MAIRKDEANPLYWDSLVQNCPGTNKYDPSMPRLYIWDSKQQVVTAACNNFVDDPRSVPATQKLARDATHCVDTVMGYLGLQEATRKRSTNSQTTGEWTGYITLSLENVGLFVTMSERNWGRDEEIIYDMLEKFNDRIH